MDLKTDVGVWGRQGGWNLSQNKKGKRTVQRESLFFRKTVGAALKHSNSKDTEDADQI